MLAKRDIERQLEHFKGGACGGDPETNRAWIEVLEWVLGSEEHRAAHASLIEAAEVAVADIDVSYGITTRVLAAQMRMLIGRLK